MARGALLDFVEHPDVEEIVLVDRDADRLQARAKWLSSGKVRTVEVPIEDSGRLSEALRGSDVCLNATFPELNRAVMECCLEAGLHYTDFGGLFHWVPGQFELHEKFERAGLTAVAGSGSAPGIVNVMAAYAAAQLDSVEGVRILDGIVNFAPSSSPFAAPYAIDTLVREFTMNPVTFRDGEWVEVLPFAEPEEVDFPAPVGRQTVFHTIHSEPYTIPLSFKDRGIRHVSFKLSLPNAFETQLRLLVGLGLFGESPVATGRGECVPRDLTMALIAATSKPAAEEKIDDHKCLRVVTDGRRDERARRVILDMVVSPYQPWGLPTGTMSVGFPAAVTCRLLGSDRVTRRGVYGSEACIPPEEYFEELAKREMKVVFREEGSL
jgi:lysine 6-dehydrogenase